MNDIGTFCIAAFKRLPSLGEILIRLEFLSNHSFSFKYISSNSDTICNELGQIGTIHDEVSIRLVLL